MSKTAVSCRRLVTKQNIARLSRIESVGVRIVFCDFLAKSYKTKYRPPSSNRIGRCAILCFVIFWPRVTKQYIAPRHQIESVGVRYLALSCQDDLFPKKITMQCRACIFEVLCVGVSTRFGRQSIAQYLEKSLQTSCSLSKIMPPK